MKMETKEKPDHPEKRDLKVQWEKLDHLAHPVFKASEEKQDQLVYQVIKGHLVTQARLVNLGQMAFVALPGPLGQLDFKESKDNKALKEIWETLEL